MKKYFVIIVVLATIAACNNGNSTEASADSSASSSSSSGDISSNPDYTKGLALISTNDCLGCHKVSEKLTGPAYQDVANKYQNTDANVKMLAAKVIAGGKGVWGDVAMTPHPALSEGDAEQMVKYILLLRTNK